MSGKAADTLAFRRTFRILTKKLAAADGVNLAVPFFWLASKAAHTAATNDLRG